MASHETLPQTWDLHRRAIAAHAACRFEEAETLCRESLRVLYRTPRRDRLQIARVSGTLGELAEQQSDTARRKNSTGEHFGSRHGRRNLAAHGAATTYTRGIKRWTVTLNNLAAIHQAQGEPAEGERLYRRALAIKEKVLGADHPDVAMTGNNLAVLCKTQGRRAEAEDLYRRALAIFEKALGPEHPKVATIGHG